MKPNDVTATRPMQGYRETVSASLLLLPFVLAFVLFFLIPAIHTFYLSLTESSLTRTSSFVGLANYVTLVGDASFWASLGNTFYFALLTVIPLTALGLVMAMLLASLRGIDPDIWKAARLDGIPAWRVYLSIVLPMLGPSVATVFLLLSTAVIKLFDAVVAMTQGGPGTASEVPAKFIMDHLFLRSNVGLASAGAVVLLVPVLALLAPYAYARSRRKAV